MSKKQDALDKASKLGRDGIKDAILDNLRKAPRDPNPNRRPNLLPSKK